jgi:hypothetical protein
MLKGDLTATSLAPVLLDLAESGATGSLVVNHPDGDEAQVFLRSGLVCGISATNRRSDLGAKLVSSGVLAPEALSDALEAQRTDLAAWNLGELLVHLGYVDEDVVQGFVTEQLHEALWDLLRWTEGRWKFRKNAKTREDVGPPHTVVELLESLRERGYEWEEISSVVTSPEAIPMLSARGDGAPETTLDSDAWSMLCKIDGVRSVAELANDCGYTMFEAGQVLVTLVDAGLVDINDDLEYDAEDVYGASALATALAGGGALAAEAAPTAPAGTEADSGDDALTRLARLASDVTSRGAAAATTTNPLQLDVMAAQLSGAGNLTVGVSRRNGETFAASMGRVSGALADALGPAPENTGEIDSLVEVRKRPKTAKTPPAPGGEQELERRRRLRAAAAAELAEAQAAAESLRPDHDVNARTDLADALPKLVDLDTERARVAAREAEEASRHASEGAARQAAEAFARAAAEQAARHAAEQAERQTIDESAQAQAAAEQAAAEQAAMEQAAAEQATAEAAQALAAQHAQAAAAEAARLAAEQAEREATEFAAAEAARLQAEEQAEIATAAEAARLATEQAEREAADAAQRHADEQAALAQAAAAEEAQRLAINAQRLADEQAILAAQASAQQAANETARLAQQEAVEAGQRADQAAAAASMLAELHHTATEAQPEPVVSVVPDPEPEPEPDPEPARVNHSGEAADTAALLRELSSLGVEDDARPSLTTGASRAPRPNHVDPKKAKKKIGLFGL